LYELKLLRGLSPGSSWMIRYDCFVCILLAGIGSKGGKEFGDSLDFRESLMDFRIFEIIIKDNQKLSQINPFLVSVTLVGGLNRQSVNKVSEVELMIRDQLIQVTRRNLICILRVGFRNFFLLKDYFFN
jgi:hypothetical protein